MLITGLIYRPGHKKGIEKGKEVEWGEGEEGEGTNSPSLDSEGGEGGGQTIRVGAE